MSLIIKADLNDVYNIICSRNFISKVFAIPDKSNIVRINGKEKIQFNRLYTKDDLNEIESFQIPENVKAYVGGQIEGFGVMMETYHEVIKKTKTCFIIKYSSILKKPDYVYQVIGNTKIVTYVEISVNQKDNQYLVVHSNKKVVSPSETDDDTLMLNASKNDVVNDMDNQYKLVISEHIIRFSETIFGESMFNDVIMPFVHTMYNTVFDLIEDVYFKRFIKYFSKKHIEILKKK